MNEKNDFKLKDRPEINSVRINIYADEIQSKKCPISGDLWHYMGLIVEDLNHPLVEKVINLRYRGNLDENSLYFKKNNVSIHWSDLRSADTKNVCKRWFEYIMNPVESKKHFYFYMLGLNNNKLISEEFDINNEFNSKYNRFFRSAISYATKTFFPNKHVLVENVYHEKGQQESSKVFPWHSIYKLKNDKNLTFKCNEINFISKDHNKQRQSHIIQLCDCLLGVNTAIIHGIEKSKGSIYREELANLFLPLMQRMINEPKNKNSSFQHHDRIIARFFPKNKTELKDPRRLVQQFYITRDLFYVIDKSKQIRLFN